MVLKPLNKHAVVSLWQLQISIRNSASILTICVQTVIQILPKTKENEDLNV